MPDLLHGRTHDRTPVDALRATGEALQRGINNVAAEFNRLNDQAIMLNMGRSVDAPTLATRIATLRRNAFDSWLNAERDATLRRNAFDSWLNAERDATLRRNAFDSWLNAERDATREVPPSPPGARPHPATYSFGVRAAMAAVIWRWTAAVAVQEPVRVIDLFGGDGGIHALSAIREWTGGPTITTTAVEIEPEWANAHPRNVCMDVREFIGSVTPVLDVGGEFAPGAYHVIATSPCYGNRMADTYMGSDERETCRSCAGSGDDIDTLGALVRCRACNGTGHRASRRYTYTSHLGRPVTDGSAAAMQWGQTYREFHADVMESATGALTDVHVPPLALINISDHIRDDREQGVHLWWASMMGSIGWTLVDSWPIQTRRMGHGANRSNRVSTEWLLTFVLQ